MTTLLISPDFASHYGGLAVLGKERLRHGERVIVATGPALRSRVVADGFEHLELVLGAGSNGGISRLEDQPPAERERLRAFYAATRRGMVETIAFQVAARESDMLWRPDAVTARLATILDMVRPRHVIVDQLAFGATLALRALEHPFVSFLPSHPCQLPPPGLPDGFPVRFPRELAPPSTALAALRTLCEQQAERFTAAYNTALVRLNPAATPLRDAASTPAPELTLVAFPRELAPEASRPGVELIGAVTRSEAPDAQLAAALAARRPGRPTAYVSLGTFLSMRQDVLRKILDALRRLDLDAIVSTGVADPAALGSLPPSWHVRPTLPQVAAIAAADVVVCHGGNNTVMEALVAGVPVLAGPLSSDQFVAAEDLRRAGVGDAFDPNRATAVEIASRLTDLLAGPVRDRVRALAAAQRVSPGATVAWKLILGGRADPEVSGLDHATQTTIEGAA